MAQLATKTSFIILLEEPYNQILDLENKGGAETKADPYFCRTKRKLAVELRNADFEQTRPTCSSRTQNASLPPSLRQS